MSNPIDFNLPNRPSKDGRFFLPGWCKGVGNPRPRAAPAALCEAAPVRFRLAKAEIAQLILLFLKPEIWNLESGISHLEPEASGSLCAASYAATGAAKEGRQGLPSHTTKGQRTRSFLTRQN